MVVFLDTSILIKLYYKESDSEYLVKLVTENATEVYLFEIAKVEFVSAIWKKVRIGDMSSETAKKVIACFETDYNNYNWIYIDSSIILKAKSLFEKYGNVSLKTLDALQLGSCLSVKDEVDVFLTGDDLLKGLFEKEGLKTFINE